MEPKIVSKAEWLRARRQLLTKEKAWTRQRDALSEERRQLPWVKVDKDYLFDGPNGRQRLGDLFGERSQLVVYHFMFGPGRKEGCPSCSFMSDHIDASLVHLGARDVAVAVISRAPYNEIDIFKRRMGWRFNWVSSFGTDFNHDFHVSFTRDDLDRREVEYNFGTQPLPKLADGAHTFEEWHGMSVFAKNAAGEVFHTYSTYARGAEGFIGAYEYLDIVPKGRNEANLPWPMAWVRHHDRY